MDFTDEEKDVIANALHNYFEAISDALSDSDLMSKEYDDYFKNRLTVIEYLIERLDPERMYV